MEEEETEISEEELQSRIRGEVHKARLTSPGLLRKYRLLQSLHERRKRQATRFLELCQSVMVFENTVKELYSQLGWDYVDLDSDSDNEDDTTSCRRTLPFLFVSSEQRMHTPSASWVSTLQSSSAGDRENQDKIISQKTPVVLNKEAVLVLNKLTSSQIAEFVCPSSPDDDGAGEDIFSSVGSDIWEPDVEMCESDWSDSSFSITSRKKRKIDKNREIKEKLNPCSKKSRRSFARTRRIKTSASTSSNISNNSSVPEMSVSPETSDSDAEKRQQDTPARPSNSSKTTKCLHSQMRSTSQTKAKTKTPIQILKTTSQATKEKPTPPPSTTVSAESNVVKVLTNTKGTPATQTASKTTSAQHSSPKGEIKLNMNVLARKKAFCWQQGKVAEIITKDNGKVKYKITFEEKGKILVSGHHLAFEKMPKLEELSIGCRVVVKCPNEKDVYQPGIMAELPGRRNRMRFLVYIDDHTPMYVSLPALRLVCRQLADPLDDILDSNHREFMRQYLSAWPYPPQTQYKVGQVMKAEFEGVMQKCQVITVDCSLIEVTFEIDQHKEWLYRGSVRLEHILNMKTYRLEKPENTAH